MMKKRIKDKVRSLLNWRDSNYFIRSSRTSSTAAQATRCETCQHGESGPHHPCHYARDAWGHSFLNNFRDGGAYNPRAKGWAKSAVVSK